MRRSTDGMVNPYALAQGQLWWADSPRPVGSAPGIRRPVLVVQGDVFNRNTIATVVVVPLTGNLVPGRCARQRAAKRIRPRTANVSQIVSIDRDLLDQLVGNVDNRHLDLVLSGIDLVLGR